MTRLQGEGFGPPSIVTCDDTRHDHPSLAEARRCAAALDAGPLVAYVTHDGSLPYACASPVRCTQAAHMRVTDWHGSRIGLMVRSTDYRSTFGHVRAVTVLMGGHTWHGRYGPDWSEAVTLWRSRNA